MSCVESIDVVILGAGIAGLGAAKSARDLGFSYAVFESKSTTGGLLDNFKIDGFRFDYAVHLSFATEEKVREIFDKTDYLTHPADSYCFDKCRWLKHPIQNNLFNLPPEEKVELIESFLQRPDSLVEQNYDSWLRHQYGHAIAERYPLGYTKKYWDTDATKLSIDWIGNRMRRASLSELLFGAFTSETPNTYYTKEMRYPEKGGYKSFIQPLIDCSDIRVEHKAIKIDSENKLVWFENGLCVRYKHLISTIPLPIIVSISENVPSSVVHAAKKLKATSLDLISVAFNKNIVKDLWFYIYDKDIFASRAYSPSIKSPDNCPAGCSSLQFEIYTRGVSSKYQPEQLKNNTLYALNKMGIANSEDVIFMDHRRIEYGNVIFDVGMENDRALVLAYLEKSGIKTCGRFGLWEYMWSNQALLSGMAAMNSINNN